jgi:hypothetical protein
VECEKTHDQRSAIVELDLEGPGGAIRSRIAGREVSSPAGLLISHGWPKQVRHFVCAEGADRFKIMVDIPQWRHGAPGVRSICVWEAILREYLGNNRG